MLVVPSVNVQLRLFLFTEGCCPCLANCCLGLRLLSRHDVELSLLLAVQAEPTVRFQLVMVGAVLLAQMLVGGCLGDCRWFWWMPGPCQLAQMARVVSFALCLLHGLGFGARSTALFCSMRLVPFFFFRKRFGKKSSPVKVPTSSRKESTRHIDEVRPGHISTHILNTTFEERNRHKGVRKNMLRPLAKFCNCPSNVPLLHPCFSLFAIKGRYTMTRVEVGIVKCLALWLAMTHNTLWA